MAGLGRHLLAGAAIILATIFSVLPASAEAVPGGKCENVAGISLDELIASCNSVIDSGAPGSAAVVSAHIMRAKAYREKGDLEKTIFDYTVVIKLQPANEYAYRCRGEAHFSNGQFDLAIADLNTAIQLEPGRQYAYYVRGFVYIAKTDLGLAIEDFSQAIRIDPKYTGAYFGRATAYKNSRDYGHAIEDYDRVIELDRGSARALRARGIANLQAGSLGKSVADLSQSSAQDTNNANTALWLDIARKRNGLPSQLPERTSALDMSKWPAPIIRLFLGEITWEAVVVAADDADPKTKKGQVCEANFFIGELALQNGMREEARRRFELAAADCPKTFSEWQAANVELRAMDTNP